VAVSHSAAQMKFSIAAAIVVLAAFSSTASAQVNDAFSWGLTAGAAVPVKELKKGHETGVSAGITFAFGGVGQLFGIRVDGMINRFGEKTDSAGNARILSGTVNLVYSLLGSENRVYLIGGVGAYGIRPDVPGQDGKTDFGTNGGIGLWLPGISGFIEARYHHFYRALPNKRAAAFVPITLGILL
jgi:hypothetical protein